MADRARQARPCPTWPGSSCIDGEVVPRGRFCLGVRRPPVLMWAVVGLFISIVQEGRRRRIVVLISSFPTGRS